MTEHNTHDNIERAESVLRDYEPVLYKEWKNRVGVNNSTMQTIFRQLDDSGKIEKERLPDGSRRYLHAETTKEANDERYHCKRNSPTRLD